LLKLSEELHTWKDPLGAELHAILRPLAEQIARLKFDKNRLVYIDIDLEEDMTPTINLFNLKNRSERAIDNLANIIVSIVKSVNEEDKLSGNMERMLKYCTRLLLRKGNTDFEELLDLLDFEDETKKELIKEAKKSPNKLEKRFFKKFNSKRMEQTKEALSIRIEKIIDGTTFNNFFTGESTIDLEKEMNTKGKVIIFKVSKSDVHGDYQYFARFILGLIQTIALNRAKQKEKDRVNTYCYIDEFHNFITPTIEEILTESRKYGLYLTLAHQTVGQIKSPTLRDIILSNTNIKIIGKSNNKTLEALNKALNTNLEDAEKLNTGEFYLSVGNNTIIKVKNTDELLKDDRYYIKDYDWENIKNEQLKKFYREIRNTNVFTKISLEVPERKEDKIIYKKQYITIYNIDNEDKIIPKITEFINAINNLDLEYFKKVNNEELYREIEKNFEDKKDGADGYIIQKKLSTYFNKIYNNKYFQDNDDLLKYLKSKDLNFLTNITKEGIKRIKIIKEKESKDTNIEQNSN